MNAPMVLNPVEGELRILDTELGTRLGFGVPLDIRKLIKRHEADLARMGVLATVAKTSSGKGGRPTDEYYLNRKQAVFITAKSETPEATDITIEIIERFDAYERGVAPPALALTQVSQQIADMRADFIALQKRVEAGHDPTQNLVTDWLTMHEILEKQRAHPRGRRGLSIRCSARLRRWCYVEKREGDVRPGKAPARYMFHWDAVRLWLADEGLALIRAHNDAITGQGVLRLVPAKRKGSSRPEDDQPGAPA